MNTHREPIRTVALDRERTIRMDANAIWLAEEKTGKVLWPYVLETWQNLRLGDYLAILWACLLDEDPTLTIEQVGRMLRPGPSLFVLQRTILDLYTDEWGLSEHDEPARPIESGGENGGPSLASTSTSATASSGD